MSSETMEIFIAAYETEQGAGAALKDFQAAHRAGLKGLRCLRQCVSRRGRA